MGSGRFTPLSGFYFSICKRSTLSRLFPKLIPENLQKILRPEVGRLHQKRGCFVGFWGNFCFQHKGPGTFNILSQRIVMENCLSSWPCGQGQGSLLLCINSRVSPLVILLHTESFNTSQMPSCGNPAGPRHITETWSEAEAAVSTFMELYIGKWFGNSSHIQPSAVLKWEQFTMGSLFHCDPFPTSARAQAFC